MSQDAGFVVSGRNYGLVPMQGQATDAETQLARLEDFMNAGYDAEAAKRAREYYGEGVPIEHISEEDMSFFAGAAFARIKGVPNNPEAYWHAQKKDIPDVEREQMFELLGAELRQQVRSRWDERQARIKAVEESLGRMDVYVRGDEFGEAFSEQDLANVRGVMDAETMADAEAVRAWMRTYMLPLAGKDDAEEVLRTVDGLEDEFFEVIGTSPRRAEMAYNAMLHWAEGMKQSGKVGVADEFIVGVGKKISNWGKAAHLMAPAVAMAPVGNPDFPIMLSDEAMAGQQAELASRHEEYARHENARSILRAAINKSLELGDNVSWWKGAARTASQMAGDSSAYLLPGVGMYTGTADLLMGGATETVDRFALQGLSGDAAAGQAAIETGVQTLVELTPWGRVGGKGFSAFTRRYFGEAIEKGTAGKLSRWVVRNTQNSTMRALVAEGTVSFVDEGILEPIAGGLMTYGAEQAADVLGIPHGQSREFTACFDELKALYTDPYQAAGLFLFTAGLTGAGAYGVRENVRYFAKHRKMWEAAGLTPEQVDRVMAADDRVELGGKLVREGWESDPAGMRERVLKANKDIAERGEVLVLTGEGALDAELENSELAPAYRAVWQEYQDKGLLPKVEAVGNNQFRITKESVDITLDAQGADAYLQHAIDEVDSIQTRELQQRLGKEHFIDLRAELADAVSTIAGNAAMRAAEAAGERTGIAVTDITKGLPEWLADGIVKRGQITLKDAQDITEWAIGRIDGLVQEGMSPADARLTRASADGMARTLGDWSTFARDFAHREQMAGLQAGTGAISISRTRNEQAVTFDGRQVLGQTIMTLPGNVRHQGAVEDVTESFADMMVQQRAQAIREANPDSSPAEAENAAWQELGEVVQRARAAVLKADAEAEIEEVKPGDKMSIIEALSTMATSRFVASRAMPGWMQGLTAALKGNLAAADSLAKVRAAYASVLQNDPSAVSELDAMLDKLGVYVQDTFREARVEAVDIQAWKHAHALVAARAESPAGSGGALVSEVVQEAERTEAEIGKNAERFSGTGVPRSEVEGARESQEILNGMVPGSNAPAGMQGVFVDDKCYYNAAGGFWCGMIDKHKLRDGTEQVKVGAKGKHGVIAGRELTGKFQQNVGAIYVWKRTNGELQVISGRHRFAKLMEDDSAQSCNAYVFEEDAEHDERWARMLDYENNMRDDQADEVTAATYVRETGLSDTELEVRGLMRNGTRCKRGALIGRFAREELWTRFINGAVKPMDAEVICNLTRSIRDQGRVEEIQRRCCMLLDEKKSWEYIGAMVQLMANKENVVMKQGLLDFGADFEADLARAAEWVERNIKAINESVSLLKQGRKLSGKKRAEAERLGITTATQEGTEQMLYDLEQLRAQFEMIGSYPDLVAAAQMWDGKTEVDPVAQYLERARAEREQVRAEGEMDVEEYLAEQARKEAAEAVPSLFSMEMEKRKLLPNQIKVKNKAIVTFNDGVVRNAHSRVLRTDGREVWAQFPEIEELKNAGFPAGDVVLEVGSIRGGFLHLAIRHGEEIQALYPEVSLLQAIELFIDEVFSKLGKARGSYVGKGKKRKMDVDSKPYEVSSGVEKKKRVSLSFHKAPNAQFYTVDTAFESAADKDFAKVKVEKDGQSCTVTVELDGKAPGLPTGATLNPSSARPLHARRPSEKKNITPGSKVKGEDIDFEFLRKAKHPDVETGARFRDTNFSASLTAVTPEMDERYMAAVKRGDMDAAQCMVNEVARKRGYLPGSDYQGSECFNGTAPGANAYFDTDDERYEAWENGDFEGTVSLADFVRRGMDPGELEWLVTSPGAYQRADKYKRESIDAIRKAKASKRGKVTIYRAVPADIKEGSVRNGDWVTLSKAYAEYHISLQDWEKGRIIKQEVSIDDVWWDGNDVNEWGYDDGKEYAYRNTANNRKLLAPVTYDENGDVVPLSKRFNYRSSDVSFSLAGVTTDWKNTLHGYLNNPPLPGTPAHTHDLTVCPTPAVMQMVGAKGWDIVVTPGVLDKVTKGKHAVNAAALEKLPSALSSPICIAISDTPGCLEVVTELKEGENNVLVAVQLNSEHSSLYKVKVNRIASMYGKEKIGALLTHPMLYWDKAKARPWLNNYRLQLPAPIQPKRASGRTILKPADLVKYKMEKDLSFSLRGRGMIDAVDLGVMAREEQMQRLVSYARREAARWERTFAKDTSNAKAAEAMGAISSIQGAIMRVLPPTYRPALSAQMRYVEVYARMLESGRVSAKGKLSKDERAALLEQMQVELGPKMEGLKADAARELKHLFVRDWGEANLAQAAARMLNDAADAVERRMIDVELECVERMKERLAPRKLPNGKYDKGKMSAEAYKEFVRFCGLMELDAEAVAEKLHELEALIAAEEGKDAPDAARVDELAAKMAELVAYGNLKGKSLEAVRKGVAALTAFVQNERNVWQGKLERERERAKRSARVMAEQMGPGDEVKLAENAEKAEETLRMFGSMGGGFKSLAQMFYGMGGIPGLRSLMDESLETLAHGHVQLGLREKRAYDQLGEFLEKELGLNTETKRNDWMAGLKKKIDTGVKRAGELVTHKLELTQEEAEGWLELDKAEREEKRRKMLDEAEKAGVDAQNVVYEEDLPLLRDELAKFDDLPGKRKFIRTERSWRKEQAGNIVASRDEILNILLLCEQTEYQQAADENGYTAEVLENLRAAVGEDVMAFGHEMRRVLEGSGLTAVYEAREGIPFPAVQNYWPGKFDLSAKMNEQANALDPTTGTGTRYGMLITRVKHKLKFNLNLGASNVFLAALAQQNNYICMGELTARWRRLLSHSNFAMSLKQRLGEKQFKQLKEFINLLDGAGIAESVTQQNLSSLVGRFQSAHAMAVLAGSPITLIKQTSAMLHAGAWEGISPGRVLWHLLKDRAGKGAISYGEIVQMDCFKVRHRDNRYFTEMMQLGRNANWSKLATWARTGMGWIEKMDIACNAASMTALYNINYEQLQEANAEAADPLSEVEMRGVCAKAVEQALELAAQPLRRTQKSAMAALSRNALVKSACYMSSESLNKIGMYAAIKQRNGGGIKGRVAALKFLLPMSIAQQATVMVLDMLRGSAPDSGDDDWAEWFWLNVATGCTGLGMLQSVPMLGEFIGWATGGYVKTASLGEMLFDFRGAVRSGKRLWKMGTDGRDYSGWEWAWQLMNAGRIVTAGTAAGRGINSTSKVFSEVSGGLQSLNAVVNHVRPVIQRYRNKAKEK